MTLLKKGQTMNITTPEEMKRVLKIRTLANGDLNTARNSLDYFLRSLPRDKYLLGSVFYVCFVDMLTSAFGGGEGREKLGWLRYDPGIASMFLPGGSFFRIVFEQASFPPKFEVPLHQLPRPAQRLLKAGANAAESPLFAGKLVRHNAGLFAELTIYEYFFFSLAAYPLHDRISPKASNGVGTGGPASLSASSSSSYRLGSPSTPVFHRSSSLVYQQVLERFLFCFFPHNTKDLDRIMSPINMPMNSGMGGSISNGLGVGMSVYGGINTGGNGGPQHISSDHWRSLLLVLCEQWMNQNSYATFRSSFMEDYTLPADELFLCVRRLILHLLASPGQQSLANTMGPSANATPVSPTSTSASTSSSTSNSNAPGAAVHSLSPPLQVVQSYLFDFIRSALLRWPKDWNNSFTQLSRLWLSFLTPWTAVQNYHGMVYGGQLGKPDRTPNSSSSSSSSSLSSSSSVRAPMGGRSSAHSNNRQNGMGMGMGMGMGGMKDMSVSNISEGMSEMRNSLMGGLTSLSSNIKNKSSNIGMSIRNASGTSSASSSSSSSSSSYTQPTTVRGLMAPAQRHAVSSFSFGWQPYVQDNFAFYTVLLHDWLRLIPNLIVLRAPSERRDRRLRRFNMFMKVLNVYSASVYSDINNRGKGYGAASRVNTMGGLSSPPPSSSSVSSSSFRSPASVSAKRRSKSPASSLLSPPKSSLSSSSSSSSSSFYTTPNNKNSTNRTPRHSRVAAAGVPSSSSSSPPSAIDQLRDEMEKEMEDDMKGMGSVGYILKKHEESIFNDVLREAYPHQSHSSLTSSSSSFPRVQHTPSSRNVRVHWPYEYIPLSRDVRAGLENMGAVVCGQVQAPGTLQREAEQMISAAALSVQKVMSMLDAEGTRVGVRYAQVLTQLTDLYDVELGDSVLLSSGMFMARQAANDSNRGPRRSGAGAENGTGAVDLNVSVELQRASASSDALLLPAREVDMADFEKEEISHYSKVKALQARQKARMSGVNARSRAGMRYRSNPRVNAGGIGLGVRLRKLRKRGEQGSRAASQHTLTGEGKEQIRRGQRVCHNLQWNPILKEYQSIQYHGDVWAMPKRSNESEFMIHLAYWLSVKLNRALGLDYTVEYEDVTGTDADADADADAGAGAGAGADSMLIDDVDEDEDRKDGESVMADVGGEGEREREEEGEGEGEGEREGEAGSRKAVARRRRRVLVPRDGFKFQLRFIAEYQFMGWFAFLVCVLYLFFFRF